MSDNLPIEKLIKKLEVRVLELEKWQRAAIREFKRANRTILALTEHQPRTCEHAVLGAWTETPEGKLIGTCALCHMTIEGH